MPPCPEGAKRHRAAVLIGPMTEARHNQVSRILAAEIAAGSHPVGAVLPTERELQERFAVGRHTIREALKTLTAQGLVSRRRKVGTRVLRREPYQHYAHLVGDVGSLLHFAEDTRLEVLHEGYITASRYLPEMEGEAIDRWLRLAGVRSIASEEGAPLCWSEIFLPARLALDREALRDLPGPIYQHSIETLGLKLDRVEQEIKATSLPEQIAVLIDAEPEEPALMVTRRYVDSGGHTFEVSLNLYPADRYLVRSIIRPRP